MTEFSPQEAALSSPSLATERKNQNALYGHPKGLWVLVLTEGWIAFSFYGMVSLLVLYMSKEIFSDSFSLHPSEIMGISPLLSLMNALYHPVGAVAMASAVMGIFLAGTYIGPLCGSILADRFLGRTRTVLIGAILMTLGEMSLCFRAGFVLALLLILIGNGCAGSMKAQIGALYSLDDRRRSDAYQLYSLGVQIAVILSPILCATANIFLPWKGGFLVASLGMMIAVLCYLLGRKYLPSEEGQEEHFKTNPLTGFEKKRIILLLFLIFIFIFSSLPNEELNDGYILWANSHYALSLFTYHFPVSYLMSLDGVISTITTLLVLWGLQFYERKYGFLQELYKISLGCFISALGPIFLILGVYFQPNPHQVSLLWGMMFHLLNDIGVAMIYSIGMSFFSRIAPPSYNTILVSLFVLHLVGANLLIGKLGTLLEKISNADFWGIHILASLLSGLAFLLIFVFFKKFFLLPQEQEESL